MSRSLNSSTKTALTQPTIYPVWFIRLDFYPDPVYVHTGIGDITFSSGTGVDPAIVGFLFKGIANVLSIDTITDAIDGSQALTLTLPGVSLSTDYLQQILTNADLWQRRPAYLWLATYDINGAIIGTPFRVKTGRMDQLPINGDPDSSTGTLQCIIESQQAYSGTALFSKYDTQQQIDPTDISQIYVFDLANRVATIGNSNTDASSNGSQTLITAINNNLHNAFGI
jgi:hypothetical protein